METNDTYQPIVKQTKRYFETRYKLLKLEAIDQGTSVASTIITDIIMLLAIIVAFLFFTLTLAFLLGKLLSSNWMGFGCVTLLYLSFAFFNRIFKISIENVLIRILIQKILKHKSDTPKEQQPTSLES